MSILTKVRGLWRHDGDTELVQVSRRSFLFMGGVVVAGLALPGPIGPATSDVMAARIDASLAAFYGAGRGGGKTHLARLQIMLRDHGQPFGAQGEWLMSPNAYRELTRFDPKSGYRRRKKT